MEVSVRSTFSTKKKNTRIGTQKLSVAKRQKLFRPVRPSQCEIQSRRVFFDRPSHYGRRHLEFIHCEAVSSRACCSLFSN